MKRKAYDIVLRCRLNGTEYNARLFLKDASDAFEAMYRRVRLSAPKREAQLGAEWFRVVSCEVSADQSRPVG